MSFKSSFKSLLFCTFLVMSCAEDMTPPSAKEQKSTATLVEPGNYTLVWFDEFDQGGVPDSTKWDYDLGSPLLGGTVWGNSEREHYTDNPANAYISNGSLVIQAIHETPAGASVGVLASSARLKTTTDSYWYAVGNEPYGYYEIRAKLPCVAGAWPAIWLLGKEGGWPQQGEIDIMEWSGSENNKSKVSSAIHTTDYHGDVSGAPESNPQYGAQYRSDMCSDYHIFHLHWTEEQLEMGVDNETTLIYRKTSSSSDQWPFDQPAYLILNVAVGGTMGGNVNPADIADMTMYVDYVRVWQ
jgi:beta-glucanase (GH16 family)